MAKEGKPPVRYQTLDRLIAALTLLCLCICIVASGMAGARLVEIAWRCVKVYVGCVITKYMIIRMWSSWEEVSSRR